jgi:osmoprotectant transport system substrate-binding protein
MVRTASVFLILVLAAGCSSRPRIVVGSKNFTEQVILGEILAQHLERRMGVEVERRLNLGGTLLAHEALKSGGIDLYPEYTGTALTAVLKRASTNDPKTVLSTVREGYRPWRLVWLDPLGFNNTFAMVVRTEAAQRLKLTSVTDAARRPEAWLLGVGYEFTQRPDGLRGLVETYGLRVSGEPTVMDLGLLYPALEAGKIEMAAANSTDGRLAGSGFTVLEDDRRYFPPYECAVVVREEALARYPELRKAIEELSGRITDTDMRRLNAAVDMEKRPVATVAREFLTGGGT